MEVHREDAVNADSLKHVGDDLGGDGHARGTRTAVLTGIAVVGDRSRDAAGRAHAEVFLDVADHVARALDDGFLKPEEVDRVVQVDEREDGLEQVLAVGAAAHDVQKEIELGRRGQAEQGAVGQHVSPRPW